MLHESGAIIYIGTDSKYFIGEWQALSDIWWIIAGYVRVSVISADPARMLGRLSGQVQLRDIEYTSALCVEFSVPKGKTKQLKEIVEKTGGKWDVVSTHGLPKWCRKAWEKPIIVCFSALLLLMSLYIPERIYFIQVQGNEAVARQEILNAASDAGLSFGVARRALRSEQIKNELLEAIPSLSWAGVNTKGCVATISVKERKLEPEDIPSMPGHIIAARDAVVSSFTVTRGRPLCQEGQAVRAGEVLISGYLDLGLCTRAEQAEGEVYGLTRRQVHALLPASTAVSRGEREICKKYSLIIGKKRINLYSDSGILYPSCGKMTKVKPLTLPGGWQLPVSLVTECYTDRDLIQQERSERSAGEMLEAYIRQNVQTDLVAGQIRKQELELTCQEGAYYMSGFLECHEMIGKRSSRVFIEGDTNDDRTTD